MRPASKEVVPVTPGTQQQVAFCVWRSAAGSARVNQRNDADGSDQEGPAGSSVGVRCQSAPGVPKDRQSSQEQSGRRAIAHGKLSVVRCLDTASHSIGWGVVRLRSRA